MSNTVLVTGGTGFIGSHLVEALVREGRHVRCLVRKASDLSNLMGLGVELYYGDLLDGESLRRVAKNVDIVYHLAAQVRPHKSLSMRGELPEIYRKVNFLGTKLLADACLSEGVNKFIFFSSIAAVGVGSGLTEDSPCIPITDYAKSKHDSENHLLSIHKNNGFPVVIIRPGQIYGPRCLAMLPLFLLIRLGIFMTIGNGENWVPTCYVDDLINGAFLAEKKGKPGSVYFIFENCYKFRQYAEIIESQVGGHLSRIYCPKKLAYSLVTLKELFEKALYLKICPFCMDLGMGGVISFSSTWSGSVKKAKAELGYNPKFSLRDGITHTVRWYKENGFL